MAMPDANDFPQVNKFCWEFFQLNCNDVLRVGQQQLSRSTENNHSVVQY